MFLFFQISFEAFKKALLTTRNKKIHDFPLQLSKFHFKNCCSVIKGGSKTSKVLNSPHFPLSKRVATLLFKIRLFKNIMTFPIKILKPPQTWPIWGVSITPVWKDEWGSHYVDCLQQLILLSINSSELAELVPFPYSLGRFTIYSDRLHNFSVSIPRCCKDIYVKNFYLALPVECFPWTYDLWPMN